MSAAAKTRQVTYYQCAYGRCGKQVEVESPYRDDAPEGYYFSVRRVTEYRNHSVVPEVFVCSKECLINFMQYEISHYAVPDTPIARETRRR
ncbi:hypothetical protein SEA_PUPPER_70 [Gordonia phage Pupper]|uniref:Uncharacterized protein n=1 Tax=Gordonia phage Pupper TaxID=2571249 RepID=A0A4Y6EII9_9CAUD|nr:hypothetical protein KHQ83_gp207 [Gordonia phage Pupper]QDF18556.1 hypothetical protein SEA_PUPPER_70 [Gordonia phage Pupper]